MKILVVEDEIIISDNICSILEDNDYEVTEQATDYEEAVEFFLQDKPDLVLLDINLAGDKTGIDVAQFINLNNRVPFIYTSALSDKNTIQKAKETKPAAYLVKPFQDDQLIAAIEVAMANFSKELDDSGESDKLAIFNDSIFIKTEHRFTKILVKDILYIHKTDNYLDIYTLDNRYTIRSTISGFLQELNYPKMFKTHKSYAVNLDYLVDFKPTELIIKDRAVPIAKNYAMELKTKLRIF